MLSITSTLAEVGTAADTQGRIQVPRAPMKNLALLASMLAVSFAADAAPDCAALKSFSLPTYDIVITSADVVAAAPPVPAHCRVDGTINDRIGAEGKPYGIGFGLALPTNWNQRFLFQGGGGYNGLVRPPLGVAAVGAQRVSHAALPSCRPTRGTRARPTSTAATTPISKRASTSRTSRSATSPWWRKSWSPNTTARKRSTPTSRAARRAVAKRWS